MNEHAARILGLTPIVIGSIYAPILAAQTAGRDVFIVVTLFSGIALVMGLATVSNAGRHRR